MFFSHNISSFGKPIILSTGMNDLNSISKAVEIIRKHNLPLAILHTTNLYPTPNNLVRLGALEDLKSKFKDTIVGLSDHTLSNHSAFGAIALGASIIERHFTDTKDRIGPDIICSMDPLAAKELLEGSKIIFEQRGGKKEAIIEEQITMDFAFSSIVTIKSYFLKIFLILLLSNGFSVWQLYNDGLILFFNNSSITALAVEMIGP